DPDAPGARDFLGRLASAYGRYRKHVETERWDDGPPVPCAERTEEHPRVGLYGALNWGDWQFPGYRDHVRGCDGWGNLEYDLPQVLALAYAATGSRLFLEGLVPAARRYLEAARAYADAGTDLFRPTPAAGDWKMGVLADGVAAVYGADGDARLRRWLVAYADALLASPGRFTDPRFALPLGQLYALTGDAPHQHAA